LDRAVFSHPEQITFKAGNAFLNAAAIDFELCFTGPTCANAASLAREVGPHSSQAWKQILQLCELDLEPAFAGAGSTGENIEDELGAIQHLAAGELLKVTTLGGRELVIENQGGNMLFAAPAGDLLGLALANVKWRGGLLQFLNDGIHHLRARRGGKLTELGQRIFDIPTADSLTFQANKNGRFLKRQGRIRHHATPRDSMARGRIPCVSRKPVKSMIWKLN
jgi:hypothetical protein